MIRTKFEDNFPSVVSNQPSWRISSHPEHKDAKDGDLRAAMKLVNDLMNPEKIIELGKEHPNAILVPVIGVDENLNKIPLTYAMAISRITGLEVNTNIIKANETAHTNKGALERMLSRASFEGEVKKDRTYILVDDVITTGGTLNELRNYIEEKGGHVVAATSLANAQFSTVLAMQKDTIEMIERKFGRHETEKFIREIGIGEKLEHITNSEG